MERLTVRTKGEKADAPTRKPAKELAFLHDLFIAPDWGERFAELIDEHVKVPSDGKAAYIAAGTGAHALALQERAGKELALLCVEENPESVELARAKAKATNERTEFLVGMLDNLDFPDNHFDLVIGNASLVPQKRVHKMFVEMVRIAAPDGLIALAVPTASSFSEFFSVYWEALHNTGLLDLESDVEQLILELPSVSDVERMAEDQGLEDVHSWTRLEEFDYDSGEQFLSSPLVSEFLMEEWLASVPEGSREELSREITRLINEEQHGAEFALSVKATLVVGRKTRSH
jgi:ubiquinone/menaquinone biosynthesis C-methylase UbiE